MTVLTGTIVFASAADQSGANSTAPEAESWPPHLDMLAYVGGPASSPDSALRHRSTSGLDAAYGLGADLSVALVATFNVKDFGARGDGVADDANAVQAAVDACYAAGGGVVYMPAGTYRFYAGRTLNSDLYANVNVRSGVTVKGAGPGATLVHANRVSGNAFGASQQTGIGVRDLTVYGDGPDSSGRNGVKFYCCDDTLVENVVAHYIYIGISQYGCDGSVTRDCRAYDCSIGITTSESRLGLQQTHNGLIEDCEAYDCYIPFRVSGHPPGSEVVSRANDVTLRDCYGHDSTGGAVFWLAFSSNLRLENCISENAHYKDVVFAGVSVADAYFCSPVCVATATDQPDWYRTYGPSRRVAVIPSPWQGVP